MVTYFYKITFFHICVRMCVIICENTVAVEKRFEFGAYVPDKLQQRIGQSQSRSDILHRHSWLAAIGDSHRLTNQDNSQIENWKPNLRFILWFFIVMSVQQYIDLQPWASDTSTLCMRTYRACPLSSNHCARARVILPSTPWPPCWDQLHDSLQKLPNGAARWTHVRSIVRWFEWYRLPPFRVERNLSSSPSLYLMYRLSTRSCAQRLEMYHQVFM